MNQKKRTRAIIAIVALIIVLATGFTFSKYLQTVTGNVSFELAPWQFSATTNGGKELSQIALTNEDGSAIGPGSEGSFDINVDASGCDFDIVYNASVSNSTVPENIKFYLKVESGEKFYQTLTDVIASNISGNFFKDGKRQEKYTIGWEWPLEGTDDLPTVDTANCGFTVSVTGKQVQI